MQFIREKVARLKIEWNERPLNEADFYRLCKRFKIKVQEMPLTTGGFYYRVAGKDYIAVDSRLNPPKKLIVLFHELGHYLFHTPETGATANFHGVGRRTRKEVEADVFALCAVIPTSLIEDGRVEEMIDEGGFTPEMVEERRQIFIRYGI